MKKWWVSADKKLIEYQASFGGKFMEFVGKHPEIMTLLLLGVLCYLFLFLGLDFYPLIDVDETRYAIMARDLAHSCNCNVLLLNHELFLEKPPLYFWLVSWSIKFFGVFDELSVRTPIALSATLLTFGTYFFGKKVISRKFGLVSAMILLSSVFFLMLSHIAILDMLLTVLIAAALYCGFLSHIVSDDKNKKYCWWYFYLFCGVGFLAKGILAIALPIVIMFIYNLVTKTLKDFFKPINILPGVVLFAVVAIPWHYVMYNMFGFEFIKQYFLYHHFARFIDSAHIGRERPFLYFIPVFIVGFMPWTLSFVAFLCDAYKKLVAKFNAFEGTKWQKTLGLFAVENNEQKLILFSTIYFVVIFGLMSVSSTKLPTYILPVFPAAALLTGYFWWVSSEKEDHEKAINVTTYIFAGMFIVAGFASAIAYVMFNDVFTPDISFCRTISVFGLYVLSILLILRLKTKNAMSVFWAYIFTMFFIISVATTLIFNIIYNGGQDEIEAFSKIAKDENAQLITFNFAVKPSAMVEQPIEKKINFITDTDFEQLDYLLGYDLGPTYVIIKNKTLKEDKLLKKKINQRLIILKRGSKYSLYRGKMGY